jgi:hypothetical protein
VAESCLGGNAGDGHHGEAAVLQFRYLHTLHVFLAQAQGVEGEISGLTALAQLAVGDDGHVLEDGHPDEHLEEAALGHRGGVGLEGGHAQDGVVEVSEHPAQGGEHGNAAVLELGLSTKNNETVGVGK